MKSCLGSGDISLFKCIDIIVYIETPVKKKKKKAETINCFKLLQLSIITDWTEFSEQARRITCPSCC